MNRPNPPVRLEPVQAGLVWPIALGFAYLTLPSGRLVGIVDVPGHARFIRNMLAGVHGLDAVPRRWLDGITSSSVAPPEADRAVLEAYLGHA